LALWLVPDGNSELQLSSFAIWRVPDGIIKVRLISLDHVLYQMAEVR
jgi:hypothetical protein